MKRRYFIVLLIVIYMTASHAFSGQVNSDSIGRKPDTANVDGEKKKEKQEKKKDYKEYEDLENSQMVLWQNPADISRRDLFYGIGGKRGAPNPSVRFVFLKRNTSGSSEKIEVKDNLNRKWTVKFGPEARPETTATRIVWAVGFHTDQDYFVKRARVERDNGFDIENARFERDDDGYKNAGRWSWTSNPFVGTRELDGLKTLMALLNNYDLKTLNNKIIRPERKGQSKANRHIYYVNDLGATLGSTGTWLTKLPIFGALSMGTKGIAEDFAKHKFIAGVENGEVSFHFLRRRPMGALKGVKVENARWMGNLLSRLSNRQFKDAFRAGGFDERETAIYVRAIRDRIRQLKELD